MGCCGDREKGEVSMEEKWDYVNLDDFKSESCWTPFSYFFLWVFLLVSIAVYAVDTFTAVNLLAFSRWSGRVQPAIPFRISRWIFAICIIVSFALLFYRWFVAIRAMRSGSITRNYLDPLAVRVQSFRVFGSKGRGWKRFLVFAELTKSKKGAEYVALYSYFAFQFWMNTVFADGPRQVINAITLWSVMKADLLPGGTNAHKDQGASGAVQFFNNVKILAEENNLQAVVLIGMLFTLIIWVLSVLKLASAVVLYLIFLFHHIPSEDGTLTAYCRRKIRTRLTNIVRRKVNKALAKGVQLQDRAPTQPSLASADSKPTLPSLPSVDIDKTPAVTTLSRSTTETTLPPYTRTNSGLTDKNPTLPNLELNKPPLARTTTQSSVMSESVSLTGNAAPMGYSPLDRTNSPMPPVPPIPATIPPRTGSPQSRTTPGPLPFGHEAGRGSPAPYRNLMDSGVQPNRPNRSFTPAADPYARSNTPGIVDSDDAFDRSRTPARYDPYSPSTVNGKEYDKEDYYEERFGARFNQMGPLAQPSYYPEDPYQARSYTPASTGATPRPPTSASNRIYDRQYHDGYQTTSAGATPRPPPGRSMTPASHRGSPAPSPGEQSVRAPPINFTPIRAGSPGRSQGSGYAAFNPPLASQAPQPRRQRHPLPSEYQPFTRANTASPSTMHRNGPPAGYSFNRANTDQF
ncbi:uncharacterized protein N7459_001226 [Penicillium hispanicum]|uniref:uncharacterized protein n=1 Tax=Penicillium hispanicum TaxID=1080232 RepID=UPI00253F9AA2|nr:uncharacterized protein N7459_001226 [Penicillium hispanicum]KAJ5595018.1 hypothetical protein N7459_001226 [Penicillium hispanicum]